MRDKFASLSIVPVVIRTPRKSRNTFALLDSGSQVTMINEQIAKELGL